MKKFFKILMVLALLSGAALSCTKDYSKEIADVQKKNQELEGLIATLQNAINSTNTTVSQVSALANKNKADILALATANAEAFADIIADHAADVENLEELIHALETAGVKQKEELEGAINALRVALNEGKTSIDSEIATLRKTLIDEIKNLTDKDVELAAAIAALGTKTDADIATINAALDTKADKTDVDNKVAILNAAIKTVNDALAKKTEELQENIDKSAEESKRADKALEDQLAKAKAEITSNDNRIKAIEAMLADYPEVKAQVATNKLDIDALKAQVKDLQEQIYETKEAYQAADQALQDQIDKLKEQIGTLSARLTNIVAAPAKNIECMRVKIGDSTFVNLQMDFKVAPADFAKVIADGFDNGDVTVALNVTTGYARTKGNAVSEDIDTLVTPFKVVNTKDGIISVTANLSGIVKTPAVEPVIDSVNVFRMPEAGTPAKAGYVSIIVSGTDYEGMTYERISDPVRPIEGSIANGRNILTALKWFKDGKPVEQVEDSDEAVKAIKAVNEKKDTAVANNGHLKVVLADIDWKTYGTFSNTNVLEGYELMIPVGVNTFNKPISIKEIAEMLNVDYDEVFAPYFVKNNGKTLNPSAWKQTEWIDFPSVQLTDQTPEFELFSSENKNGLEIGLGVKGLPGEQPTDKAEFVGTYYKVESNDIAYGDVETPVGYNVTVYQRIGKHVSRKEVTDPLYVPFAYNAGVPIGYGASMPTAIADHSNKKFTAVAWKGETDIERHESLGHLFEVGTTSYTLETAVKYQNEFSTAKITPTSSQTKFADILLLAVPFQAKEKEYQFVWSLEPYKNSNHVQAEDYLDYINVTVAPYHQTVPVVAKIEGYPSLTQTTIFTTSITGNSIIEQGPEAKPYWFGGKTPTSADQAGWFEWFYARFGGEDNKISNVSLKNNNLEIPGAEMSLTSPTSDGVRGIAVTVPVITNASVFGKEWTIDKTETIDNVINFNYKLNLQFNPIGATIAYRDGFIEDGVVTVKGAAGSDPDFKYAIPDINLDNYFLFDKLDQINKIDLNALNVVFSTTAAGIVIDDPDSKPVSPITKKQALLEDQCKVKWGTYKGTEFELTANTNVGTTVIANPVKVKFKTDDPVANGTIVYPNREVEFKPSEAQEISLFKGLSIIPEGFTEIIAVNPSDGLLNGYNATCPDFGFTNKYPTVAHVAQWKCEVNGQPYDLSTLIDTASANWGWNTNNTEYKVVTKPHDAIGKIEITIPCTWTYMFGTLKFDATIVIE